MKLLLLCLALLLLASCKEVIDLAPVPADASPSDATSWPDAAAATDAG